MILVEKIRNRLIRFKIRHFKDIEGWLSLREGVALYRFSSLLPKGSIIVEIGSWKGKSTYCLARGLKEGKVFAIDPFDGSGEESSEKVYMANRGDRPIVEQFINNMQDLKVLDRITTIVGLSSQFVGMFEKIDFLFIDGNHSIEACDFDYSNFSRYLVSGGYLAMHDFDRSRSNLGPTWVVENRVLNSSEYRFIGLFDSLWVGQKK
jgi:predicted O-methyltransferase YrrM